MLRFIAFLVLVVLAVNHAFAYKQPVHMKLTDYAASQSVLAGDELWKDWGVKKTELFSYQRTKNNFSAEKHKLSTLSYSELLVYGVDAEDTEEASQELYWNRAFNHFYNPQVDKKLDLGGMYTNFKSPLWSLELAYGSNGYPIGNQQFSYSDAQDYFYRAFTQPLDADRRFYMGKMFQALGHVIHHVQDMAQPEHTRLDMHCDAPLCMGIYKVTGEDDSSIYEEYTQNLLDCGAIVETPFSTTSSFKTCTNMQSWSGNYDAKKIYIGGYPVPVFNYPLEFWHTADNKGLASFSSRNFITTDTAFKIDRNRPNDPIIQKLLPYNNDVPFPSGGPVDTFLYEVAIKDLMSANNLGKLAPYKENKMKFIGIKARDNKTGATINLQRAATHSIFSERLNKNTVVGRAGTPPLTFSINYFNLEERAATLLPRAVGYSAGLINHFFRMRFSVSQEGVFKSPDVIKLKNISAYTFNGHFEFYYDTTAGVRKFHSATDKVTLAPNQSLGPLKIQVPESRLPSEKFYVVAVDGVTGRALAVKAFTHDARINDPTPPQPCDKDIVNSGGYETFSLEVNLGNKKGVSTVYVDTFTIPDTVGIYKLSGPNARIYYSWTPISGSREYKVNYDPELFPGRGINVTIVGSRPGTEWKVRVSCPQ